MGRPRTWVRARQRRRRKHKGKQRTSTAPTLKSLIDRMMNVVAKLAGAPQFDYEVEDPWEEECSEDYRLQEEEERKLRDAMPKLPN